MSKNKNGLDDDGDDVTWAEVSRSQPISIAAVRRETSVSRNVRSELFSPSALSIPDPFPELCGPAGSPVAVATLSPPSGDKHLLKVFAEGEHGRSLYVSSVATAMEVCHTLVTTARCGERENWALMEVHPALGLGDAHARAHARTRRRALLTERARLLPRKVPRGSRGGAGGSGRLGAEGRHASRLLQELRQLFFPDAMIFDGADGAKRMTSQQLIQDPVQSGSCPEIRGFLHMKDSARKSWKRAYFFLRRSGLYCSSKGASEEPRHLRYVADLRDLHVYDVVDARKLYAAPQHFCFAVTPSGSPVRLQHLKMFCADSHQTRTCWTSAFRLFKYGKQLQSNFQQSEWTRRSLTDGKAKSEASLAVIDFSGKSGGRVVDDPTEAECTECREGRAWRRREVLRRSPPDSSSASGPAPLHAGQLWFHDGVSRKQARRLLEKRGLVDGMFLIRTSQQHARCFVLSLCFELKTKHFLVITCEDGERTFVTMDDGATVFAGILQLVDFHRVNKGILPVCLKHPCPCAAL
ncbi:growth factor receptor-bound protein 10 isoform X2 [Phycodurus eques]|uniref:growth factor receptor-bound protein 10 isoform X2 n=1 Tax=Phycodurus eques TaxID=693459 RepID=UPI002ACD97BD|nr:growth factor receptor-bound protein 10 isoform X2 [Phycodurus eques]